MSLPELKQLRSGSAQWDLKLAVEVQQCTLKSGACGWSPAVSSGGLMPGSDHWDLELAVEVAVASEIWGLRLRSSSAHWDLELAVEVRQCPSGGLMPGSDHCEVRQCPLRSGACGWGPAVSIWRVDARQWPLLGPAVPTEIWSLRLRSGSVHLEGWCPAVTLGPAVPTEIWSLRLRSGSVHLEGWCPAMTLWGPAVPTEIWSLRLRSGSDHCDLRQCPLRSGACGWGPAVTTVRSGSAHWDLELAVQVRQ